MRLLIEWGCPMKPCVLIGAKTGKRKLQIECVGISASHEDRQISGLAFEPVENLPWSSRSKG